MFAQRGADVILPDPGPVVHGPGREFRWLGSRSGSSGRLLAREPRGRWDLERPAAGSRVGPDPRVEELRDAVEAVARVVTCPEPVDADVAALREQVRLFDRLESLAAGGMAATLGSLRAAGGVEADGAGSTTEWVKANTRRSGRDAARLSRLATDLPDLPGTRAALADGSITPEAADAVVSAVRDGRLGDGGAVEDALLPTAASAGPERLRSEIRTRQQRVDADALLRDELEQHARRRASLVRRAEGGWLVRAEVTDEVGAKLATAFEAFDLPVGQASGDRDPRRPEQRRADALAAMVDAVLDHHLAPGDAGVARPHLSLLIDLPTLAADLDDGSDRRGPATDDPAWADLAPGSFAWGGELSPQAVRRLACDAVLSRVVLGADSQVLDVGRATRSWSEPQRRAVNVRDRQCRGPNCSRPIGWTNIHHVRWWGRDHGPTSVDNGLALCHHCHHLVHDRGWTVDLDPATAVANWRSPAGSTVVTRPPPRGRADTARSTGHAEAASSPTARVPAGAGRRR